MLRQLSRRRLSQLRASFQAPSAKKLRVLGAPLVLAGIVSSGLACADPLYPGIYQEVSALTGFIRSVVGK